LLCHRYYRSSRDPADVDAAEKWAEEAITRGASREELLTTLSVKYDMSGSLPVLDRVISEHEELRSHAWKPPEISLHAMNLIGALGKKVEETGDIQELSRTVGLISDMAHLEAVHEPVAALNWGRMSRLMYIYSGDYNELCFAFKFLQQGLAVTAPEHRFYGLLAMELSKVAMLKFEHSGCVHCLDEAVKSASQALESIQMFYHEAESADPALTLATAYLQRFKNQRQGNDLEKAELYSELARKVNDRKWKKTDIELICGYVKLSKSQSPNDLAGIDASIVSFGQSVELAKERGVPARVRAYHGLSIALKARYELNESPSDLDGAKLYAYEAAKIIGTAEEVGHGFLADDISRIYLLHAKRSGDNVLDDILPALRFSGWNIKRTPIDNVAQLRYFETLRLIFEEGEKYGPDVLEEMEREAASGNIQAFYRDPDSC
jgi:hypothetical protein